MLSQRTAVPLTGPYMPGPSAAHCDAAMASVPANHPAPSV